MKHVAHCAASRCDLARLPLCGSIPLPVPMTVKGEHNDDERHDSPSWRIKSELTLAALDGGPVVRGATGCDLGALLRNWFVRIVSCNEMPG